MGCLRVLIEPTVRLRSLRTKPNTAAKLAWLSIPDPTLGEAFWKLARLDQQRFDRGHGSSPEPRLARARPRHRRSPTA
jgi:hypothetical protein